MISDLDSYVGRVISSIDNAGLTNNTLIIFSSDNGTTHASNSTNFHVGGVDATFFNSTAGLRGYKGSVYEGGIRVPMIAKLPGVIPVSVCDAPCYFADWFPTLCEAASIDTPAGLDGQSLWPILKGGVSPTDRKPMLWVFPEYGGQVAVRIGKWKAIRRELKTKNIADWEVYDLQQDRNEQQNLASAQPDVIKQAEAILRREVDDNDTFPLKIPGVN